jgi:Protein of unknown function (DUF1275)
MMMAFGRILVSALALLGTLGVDGFRGKVKSVVVQTQTPTPREITLSLPTTVTVGCLLALNCGFLNGCCLSLPNKQHPVVAVTSAYTNAVLKSDFFPLQIIGSYAAGSAVAGLFNPEPKPFRVSKSTIPIFALAALATYQTMRTQQLTYAAFAAGLQNSVTSVHTANLVRSAHMSGMTSDLGTFIGQIIGGNRQNVMKAKVCASLLSSFVLGGYLAIRASKSYGAVESLWFPVGLYALLAAMIIAIQY